MKKLKAWIAVKDGEVVKSVFGKYFVYPSLEEGMIDAFNKRNLFPCTITYEVKGKAAQKKKKTT